MKKKLVLAFNWKMNPISERSAVDIVSYVKKLSEKSKNSFIVIPPAIFIKEVVKCVSNKKNIEVGAQNASHKNGVGAMTGEISPEMLKDYGVRYIIVGHSERRYIFGEGDDIIREKMLAAFKCGLVPILCVGEKRKMSTERTKKFITRQLFSDIDFKKGKKMMIAYEPVWAIGGDKKVNPERAAIMVGEIKNVIKRRFRKDVKVLYGGSVNCDNIEKLLGFVDVFDGFLIGSASVNKKELECIIKKV